MEKEHLSAVNSWPCLRQNIPIAGRDGALRRPDIAARCPYLEIFPRIENILWIERAFDFAHHLQQLIAKLVVHVFGARDADAVLGGK